MGVRPFTLCSFVPVFPHIFDTIGGMVTGRKHSYNNLWYAEKRGILSASLFSVTPRTWQVCPGAARGGHQTQTAHLPDRGRRKALVRWLRIGLLPRLYEERRKPVRVISQEIDNHHGEWEPPASPQNGGDGCSPSGTLLDATKERWLTSNFVVNGIMPGRPDRSFKGALWTVVERDGWRKGCGSSTSCLQRTSMSIFVKEMPNLPY